MVRVVLVVATRLSREAFAETIASRGIDVPPDSRSARFGRAREHPPGGAHDDMALRGSFSLVREVAAHAACVAVSLVDAVECSFGADRARHVC